MRHGNELLGSIVIGAALLLACCTPATGARVSSGLLADVPSHLRHDVEIASRAAEAASRRLQQEAATARLLPPEQVQFVVSADRMQSQMILQLTCLLHIGLAKTWWSALHAGCRAASAAAT